MPQIRKAKPRRSAFSRVFYSLFIFGALVCIGILGAAVYGYQVYLAPGPLAEAKVFEIRKGLKLPEIGADLENAGIVSSAKVFVSAAYLTGSRGRLRAGEFQFTKNMSMHDVLGMIVQGKSIVYKLTVPEGWTTAQALDRIRSNDILTGDITLSPMEGALLPDTYIFRRHDTRDDVVRNMMDSKSKLLDELWPKRSPDIAAKTPEAAVILASIVEKETGVPEERGRVAAVFNNRLRANMRLQSDPTIAYGITLGKTKLDRPLTRKDIDTPTPYNTYQIDGLPPGPIANPGRAAIEAVLAPDITNDLYFVADGTGGHAFAETLDEHRKNVQKWREIEKKHNQPSLPVMEDDSTHDVDTAAPPPVGAAKSDASEPVQQKPEVINPPLPPIEPDQVSAGTQPAEPVKGASGQPAADPAAKRVDAEPAPVSKPAQPVKPVEPEAIQPAPVKTVADDPPNTVSDIEPSDVNAKLDPGALKKKQAEAAAAGKPGTAKKNATALKPGQIVSIANRLVPIPVPKPPAN
ncbi:endolytic transglycosylase MltG [soil metagenome]